MERNEINGSCGIHTHNTFNLLALHTNLSLWHTALAVSTLKNSKVHIIPDRKHEIVEVKVNESNVCAMNHASYGHKYLTDAEATKGHRRGTT